MDPIDKVREYSWDTAVVAFLNNELTKDSRALTKQVNGNTCLFQVCIYEHFHSFFKTNSYVKVDETVAVDKPRGQRYSFKGTQDKEMPQNLIKLRMVIDKLTADDVIFDPYRDARKKGLIQRRDEVGLYYGPLMLCDGGYSMYDPHRVMRQLGYVQEEPHFDEDKPFFTVKMDECTTSQKTINVAYDPAPVQEHWDSKRRRKIYVSLLDEVTTGREASEKYMAWYLGWARPTVIREMTAEELARKRKMASKDPATSLKFFKEQLKTFVKVWCCAKDRGEPLSIEEQSKHIDYACNIDNEDSHELFKQVDAEVKREKRAGKEAQAKMNADKKRARSDRGGEGSSSGRGGGGEGSSSGGVPKRGRGRE
ncbi:uncharacterized protein LOC113345294 [Papaver somniferum]|uniref:uncharacterized protein LOC113345294 n=1 Tax=Papaver somniferum TaxID=3469 RepID=UPI000E70223C|nr:uncharacterized protein LOC113345294 [Papaver somniferum]